MKSIENEFYIEEKISYRVIKRAIDLLGSSIALLLLSPVFIIIPLFYCFGKNKGPILFKQNRIGKNGEKFLIYKFRSMVVDAESKLKNNTKLYKKYIENNYKLNPNEDPRITNFGRFIRTTSIDELPQLINVLKGEMSLVGPRPVVEEELLEYGKKTDKFLSVKPGITGYWQVQGRSNVGYPKRVDIELYYVNHKSVLFDLRILFITFFKVILKKGAY